MPYNPGITYQGGQFLAQGINRGFDAASEALRDYAKNRAEDQFVTQRVENLAAPLKKYATYEELADENGPAAQLAKTIGNFANLPLAKKKAALVDAELFIAKKEDEQKRKEAEQWHLLAAQHQQAQDDLALKQFVLAQAADKRAQQHMDSLLASEQLRREEDAAEGRALQRFGTPAQVPDPAAVLNSPLGQLQRYAGATREETPQESARAALATLPGGRGAKGVLSILAPYAYPKQPSALDLAHLQLYQAEAEKARREANAPPFMPSVVPLGPGQGSALRTSLNSSVPWERPQAESGVTTHVDANGNVVGSTVTENGKTFFRHADPGWKYTQRPDPVFPGKMIEEWTVTAPHGIAGMRAAQEQMQRANGASAPSSFEAELKLAREAISKGAPREKVAAQFKQRTGKDLP